MSILGSHRKKKTGSDLHLRFALLHGFSPNIECLGTTPTSSSNIECLGTTPISFYYQDELGSTSHVADASGALLEYYKYDLYGKPTYFDAINNQLSTSNYGVGILGNGGSRWMPELGLYDNRNRFMSPDLGRFLQPDPIGFKGDASNLYRYCGNDWANKTDPLGLDTYTEDREFNEVRVSGIPIWGERALPSGFRFTASHTFVFTTDKEGHVAHTYSWGNTEKSRGWNKDRQVDIDAAKNGLKKGYAWREGDSKLDPYIAKAYGQLDQKKYEHDNQWFHGNCKTEAGKLVRRAESLQKREEEKKKESEKSSQKESKPTQSQTSSTSTQQNTPPQGSSAEPADIGGDGSVMNLGFSKAEGLIGAGGGSP